MMNQGSQIKNTKEIRAGVPITWIDYLLTFGFFTAALLIGVVAVWCSVNQVALALLWAFACMVSGIIIGFLFGIPRVLQQDSVPAPAELPTGKTQNAGNNSPSNYRQQVNTNLEQISDWLTKIIVGIGLVELRRLPDLLNQSSAFIARGLDTSPSSQTVAAAIIVYFGIVGFLGGYTVTRIYLAGAFKRADTGEGGVLEVGGNELDTVDAIEQQGKLIKDLLDRTANIQNGAVAGAAQAVTLGEKVMAGKPLAVKSILWVDDNPKNNSYLMDSLKSKGIEIVTADSTAAALKLLEKRSFERIITDMGRQEGNTFTETAGIDLITKIRASNLTMPVIVYCSEQAAAKYRQHALGAGATEITASPSFLLNALNLNA